MFLKILLLFLIVNFVSDSYGQREKKFFRKDYTYLDDFESFYKIHVIPQAWIDAKRMCELEGAILWHPDTDEEARGVMKFWNKTKPRTKWLYVGLSDLLVEGVFVTVDGKPVSEVYNNWEPDTPDNGVTEGGNQDCVYIYLNKGPGYLDDEACHEKYSYMCRKRLQSVEWNYQCDMPYLDYTFNKENGYCYKLHTTPLNWTDAYVVCQGEQSSLAVIRSPSDAECLARLTDITPKPRIKGSYQKGIFHLGFHSRLTEDWLTISGSQLNLDSDAWYDHYQPDGNDPDDCGSMLHSGRLINVNCDTKSLFICEHAVDAKNSPEIVGSSDTMLLQPYIGARVD